MFICPNSGAIASFFCPSSGAVAYFFCPNFGAVAHFLRPSYGVIAQFLGTCIMNFWNFFAFLPMKEDFLEFFNQVSILNNHSVKIYQKLADQCRVPLDESLSSRDRKRDF